MHATNFFAYLDAGTGSLIIQSLIGVFAGVVVFGRRFFAGIKYKIAHALGRGKKTEDDSEAAKSE